MYPYFSDNGTGRIDLQNVSGFGRLFPGGKCKYHINCGYDTASIMIKKLMIKFDSNYSLIYDSIMSLISEAMIQFFNE